MNYLMRALLLAAAAGFAMEAMADARLEAQLKPVKGSDNASKVALNLVNIGDQVAFVSRTSLPKPNARGMLLNDSFVVKRGDGRSVEYIGILLDEVPTGGNAVPIPAGGELTVEVELHKSYRISPGTSYSVVLRTPIAYSSGEGSHASGTFSARPRGKWNEVRPLPLSIIVPLNSNTVGNAQADDYLDPVACTDPEGTPAASQKSAVFQNVLAAVTNGAGVALSQLQQMTSFDTSSPPDFWLRFTPSVHYTRFFGEHGPDINISAGETVGEDDALVDSTLLAIIWRIAGDGVTQKPPVTLSCRCEEDEVPSNTMAYVQPGAHYVIHTCPLYWDSPMLPGSHIGEPSKLGTTVHEFTHFTDSKGVALTHPPVPDRNVASLSYALELAGESHSGAVRFPNAYKFFVLGQVHGLTPPED